MDKQVTELTSKAIAVTIPPEGNINNSYLWGYTNQWWVRYNTMPFPNRYKTHEIKLPEGTWAIEGVGDRLTEEQWKGIVETVSGWSKPIYYNYAASGRDYRDIVEAAFETATESGLSLLKSKGLNPSEIIILIKQ